MKVLLTGVTSNQCKAARTSNTFYSGTKALYNVLSKMPDVDFDHGNPGDFDFNEYDTVFLGIYALNSLGSAGRAPEVCRQLLNLRSSNTHVILHYDDWHVHAFRTGLNAASKEKNARRLYTMFHPGKDVEAMVHDVVQWAQDVKSGERGYHVLLPMMAWAFDRTGMVAKTMGITRGRFIPYDYCAAFEPIELPKVEKEPGWVLATKYDYSDYIAEKKFTWPVIRYGCKKNGDNYLPNEEDVIREAFTKYWGLISHPYPPKLRGQGRDKYMLATWTGSIIINEPGEADNVPEYRVSHHDIEKMSTVELAALAEAQRRAYTRESWNYAQLEKFVRGLL